MEKNQQIKESREALLKSRQIASDNARGSFSLIAPYFVIGVLSHLVNEAKPHMASITNARTWSTLNENVFLRGAFLTKWLKWGGIIGAVTTSICGILYLRDEKKAQKDLKEMDFHKSSAPTEKTRIVTSVNNNTGCEGLQTNVNSLIDNPGRVVAKNSIQMYENIAPSSIYHAKSN